MPPRKKTAGAPADLCPECFPTPDSYPADATSVGCAHGTWTLGPAPTAGPAADVEE